MKIVLYKDNLATGRGADKAICSLADALSARGHDITLATGPDIVAFSFPTGSGVAVEHMERHEVRDFVRGFDLCIAAGPNEILDLTCSGRVRPPVKTIVELLVYPMGFFKWRHPLRNMRLKRALDMADVLQIQIAGYADCLKRFAPHPRIEVIGNWADIAEASGDKAESKTILYLAAVNKSKNQLLLINAFARIAGKFPDWQLHIYGAANRRYGERCMAAIRRHGLCDRIKMLPFTNDLPSTYSSAAFMAYPSLLEGFPLAMVEGMSYRLPVVAVNALPGVGDMVLDGETGFVTDPTPAAYASGLERLMADSGLCRRLGGKAREFSTTRYSREKVLAGWDALIASLQP